MKKFISLMAVAVLLTGWSTPSQAGNPYASANIGIAWFNDLEATESDFDDRDYSLEVMLDSGIAFTGALGYDMGDTRAELEFGYQNNDAASAVILDNDGDVDEGPWNYGGDISVTTLMVNGYYDIDLADSGLELFLTAGLGGAFYSFDDIGDVDDEEYRGSTNGSTWAYQLGAGLSLPVSDQLMVEGRYRYFNTAEFTTEDDFDAFDNHAMNMDITTHSMLVGLRYNL
ncbi:MAG: outer membrane beta-barrel protein [Prosthecochloris sp.]|nr:outer membrane beta-barrel protein [Prosthecochloris sp.]